MVSVRDDGGRATYAKEFGVLVAERDRVRHTASRSRCRRSTVPGATPTPPDWRPARRPRSKPGDGVPDHEVDVEPAGVDPGLIELPNWPSVLYCCPRRVPQGSGRGNSNCSLAVAAAGVE